LTAIRPEGVISIIGFFGGRTENEPSYLNILQSLCTVRGLLVGSRNQFRDMNASIDANKIKPVVDSKVFELNDFPQAYQYRWDQKHVGKVTLKISQ
jgi:NADPH:quinone reductase-like Zn-dependent oxidoreductase